MMLIDDPARIDTALDSRSISFENPSGGRGQGGSAARGRKGAASRLIASGETVVLADIAGPGRVRHVWMTFPPGPPEAMRSVWMEVYYEGLDEPSISVPCLDFFALPHGRPTPYFSALTSAQEGRGLNAYFPMPFNRRVRIEVTNSNPRPLAFYYQIDYTLEKIDPDAGHLHVMFRRENPTTLKQDFLVAGGLKGPGRFLGCAVGIRVLRDDMLWYGEGEFKIYRDGDHALPTYCGTGLEDYVGSAWGMGQFAALYAGVPVNIAPPEQKEAKVGQAMPDFVGFYRWHLVDPIIFHDSFTATIQQIGVVGILKGHEEITHQYEVAGAGWQIGGAKFKDGPYAGAGLAERRDDYCATAFLYCREPQPVPRLNIQAALADIGLRPYEPPPKTL
jgi:hypothetical protein